MNWVVEWREIANGRDQILNRKFDSMGKAFAFYEATAIEPTCRAARVYSVEIHQLQTWGEWS